MNNVVVVKEDNFVVVSSPGPQRGGSIDLALLGLKYVQHIPSATWVISHTLPYQPNVTIVDSTGSQVEGAVDYISDTVVKITFDGAFGGEAYLS